MSAVSLVVLLEVDEDAAVDGWLPDRRFVADWTARALAAVVTDGAGAELAHELSVRLVGEGTMRALNRDWRGRDRPTNVLSFPAGLPPLDAALAAGVAAPAADASATLALGDIALCPAVVAREAERQGKRLADHWAHLLVHGTLHLAGHDHEDASAAEAMESVEIRLLSERGIPDPYGADAPTPDV